MEEGEIVLELNGDLVVLEVLLDNKADSVMNGWSKESPPILPNQA